MEPGFFSLESNPCQTVVCRWLRYLTQAQHLEGSSCPPMALIHKTKPISRQHTLILRRCRVLECVCLILDLDEVSFADSIESENH